MKIHDFGVFVLILCMFIVVMMALVVVVAYALPDAIEVLTNMTACNIQSSSEYSGGYVASACLWYM
jgi:cytoskeletal protein RodZ